MEFKEIKRTFGVALWFVFLTFPIMVIKVNAVDNTLTWRWHNMLIVGFGAFFGGLLWRFALARRKAPGKAAAPTTVGGEETAEGAAAREANGLKARFAAVVAVVKREKYRKGIYAALIAIVVIFPLLSSLYQTNIMITALIYVMLALGLNIVIGLGGMLHLGYIAFYAVGAYTYGILNHFFGMGVWVALPLGALFATVAGILLALPVLRLRGDYLAIVTLGFAEIVRIVFNNSTRLTGGPQGIGGIPRPGFFGLEMNLATATTYTYYIIVAAVVLTVFVVWRFENSRLGRALVAMGEDDIAAESMGIDITRTKVIAFALGSLWAGIGGVIFASRTTFINPASFTVWQSVIVLSCVVLGGMGSIPGAIVGALGLILIPEYLRAFSDYRMLMFGAILVIMMVFRPGGLIQKKRKAYTFPVEQGGES
ncbi:MAG: branched-chain amino acid ABC transporter permease [Spirochaeta sp.]|jgi:branched-chain amino acid transport system permease protein|nr:branched-chain amino acid ABC transporter permease [Spirochaeta sp.]